MAKTKHKIAFAYQLLETWLNLNEPIESIIQISGFEPSPLFALGCPNIAVRGLANTRLCLSEDDRRGAFLKCKKPYGYQKFCAVYVIPGEKKFELGRDILERCRKRHEFFFSWAIRNCSLPQQDFNNIVEQKHSIGFRVEGLHAIPSVLAISSPMSIQEYIEVNYILTPAWDISNRLFLLMRICPICGRIFYDKKQKAVFCSTKCRLIDHRQKKRT